MFDISFSELGIIGIIAILVFGPKECANAFRYVKYIVVQLKNFISQYTNPLEEEIRNIKGHLVDLDGEIQPTYHLINIKKELKSSNKDGKKAKRARKKKLR